MQQLWLVALVAACDLGQATSDFEVSSYAKVDRMAAKVALARMFIQGQPVLDDLNPGLPAERSTESHELLAREYGQRVADKLHELSPDLTYISGLIRINDPGYDLSPDEITAFREVRQAFPDAKLDITLSMHFQGDNNKADDLIALMKRLDADVAPGVWFYDFFDEGGKEANGNYSAHAVIDWVHTHQRGKLIGGNYFNSAPADANGTGAADFFAVVDNKDFVLDQQRINGLHNSFHAPVLMHFGNNPQNEPLDASGQPACVTQHTTCVETACQYIHNWDGDRQADYVRMRVRNAGPDNYHYMYNVFFPACPLTNYYEAQQHNTNDGRTVLEVMHDLMN